MDNPQVQEVLKTIQNQQDFPTGTSYEVHNDPSDKELACIIHKFFGDDDDCSEIIYVDQRPGNEFFYKK